jgi:hypothetical protein
MTQPYFLLRGLIAVAVLFGTSFVARTSDAAQEFHLCDLFSSDEAALLVRQPIVNTVEGGTDASFVCARYADHAATLLEVKRYPSAADARSRVPVGATIAGLGDANGQTKTYDGRLVVLWVAKGPYVVSIEINLDDGPNQATDDQLAARVQPVLDDLAAVQAALPASPLPTSQPVATGDSGCDPVAAAAISDYLNHPDVTGVRIIGGCHYVAIATQLEDSAVGKAQDICDKAVEVAYTGPLNSISVSSKDGRELAIGIKGQLCIGVL